MKTPFKLGLRRFLKLGESILYAGCIGYLKLKWKLRWWFVGQREAKNRFSPIDGRFIAVDWRIDGDLSQTINDELSDFSDDIFDSRLLAHFDEVGLSLLAQWIRTQN